VLDSVAFVPYQGHHLVIDNFFQVLDPNIVSTLIFSQDSRVNEAGSYKEVLVDEVEEILQVDIYVRFGVDGGLLTGQQVIELHNSHWNSFKLLCLDHELSELDVFN